MSGGGGGGGGGGGVVVCGFKNGVNKYIYYRFIVRVPIGLDFLWRGGSGSWGGLWYSHSFSILCASNKMVNCLLP